MPSNVPARNLMSDWENAEYCQPCNNSVFKLQLPSCASQISSLVTLSSLVIYGTLKLACRKAVDFGRTDCFFLDNRRSNSSCALWSAIPHPHTTAPAQCGAEALSEARKQSQLLWDETLTSIRGLLTNSVLIDAPLIHPGSGPSGLHVVVCRPTPSTSRLVVSCRWHSSF